MSDFVIRNLSKLITLPLQPVMQNLSEPAVLNLPSFITPNPSEPFVPGLSRICHPFPAILYAEPPRNRRAEPSRSFRVGFDPRIFFISRTYAYFHFSSDACFLFRLTPVFVVHPYARIRSYFRFSPNPAPLLPALLLFSSFTLIPAFALVSDFFSILPRFFRFYSCFRPSLYPHSLLLTSSRHIHFFYGLSVCISRQMQTYRPGRKACAASGRAFEFRNG